jgi:hypothetical protein
VGVSLSRWLNVDGGLPLCLWGSAQAQHLDGKSGKLLQVLRFCDDRRSNGSSMRRMRSGCCARAGSGHATAALPIASLYVEHQVVLAAGCCACSGGTGISAASFGVVTILSSRIVKVEPQPGALATVTSPPIT